MKVAGKGVRACRSRSLTNTAVYTSLYTREYAYLYAILNQVLRVLSDSGLVHFTPCAHNFPGGMGVDTAGTLKVTSASVLRDAVSSKMFVFVSTLLFSAFVFLMLYPSRRCAAIPRTASWRVTGAGKTPIAGHPPPRLSTLNETKQSMWQTQALHNFTKYRLGIFDSIRPLYGKEEFWSVFLPAITCPLDRPLVRYGGSNDGSKLLCKLSEEVAKHKDCVIYSLGSNGENCSRNRAWAY